MNFSVDLYRDFTRQDGITFRTVPTSHHSDCECESGGTLSNCHLGVGNNGDVIILCLGNRQVAAKYHHVFEYDGPEERRHWLKVAAEAGYLPAMCEYAIEFADPEERKHWLRKAACAGYIPAMYHYGLESDDPGRRKHWLMAAAEQGYLPATHRCELEHNDAGERRRWLSKADCGTGSRLQELVPVCEDSEREAVYRSQQSCWAE
jgi:TPR repeat protein